MTSGNTSAGEFGVQSEARGPHWIAWLTRDDAAKPVNAVVLVGETREEAEARAREYARQLAAQGCG